MNNELIKENTINELEPVVRRDSEARDEGEFGGAYNR